MRYSLQSLLALVLEQGSYWDVYSWFKLLLSLIQLDTNGVYQVGHSTLLCCQSFENLVRSYISYQLCPNSTISHGTCLQVRKHGARLQEHPPSYVRGVWRCCSIESLLPMLRSLNPARFDDIIDEAKWS